MTKSEIFKAAHKEAKATVAIVGNYSIAFSLALKAVYAESKSVVASVTFDFGNKVITHTIDTADVREWAANGNARKYFTLKSDSKHSAIDTFYEVVSGTTRDEKVTVNGKTFAFVANFANSKTKRAAVAEAALELATKLA